MITAKLLLLRKADPNMADNGCELAQDEAERSSVSHSWLNSPDSMYWQSVEELEEEKAARGAAAQE